MTLKACSPCLTTLGLFSSCSLHSGKGILGMQCLPETLTQHCHGLPPTRDAHVLPTFCGSPTFKLQGILPFPSLEGARGLLQGLSSPGRQDVPGEDRELLPLCWPGRRGAPNKLSSTFPLLSPAPSAPYMGPHFPPDTRPYSSPRELRLPPASLCTDASIPRCPPGAPGRCGRAGLCSGMGPPPAHPCSHPICHRAGALPCSPLPGPCHCREICFHTLNLLTSLIAPQKPVTLQVCCTPCFSLGVGAAEICSFWPLQPSPKLSGGFLTSFGEM